MAAWADGCSQCALHSARSSSFPLLFLPEGFTKEHTRLHSCFPSPWFAFFSVLLRAFLPFHPSSLFQQFSPCLVIFPSTPLWLAGYLCAPIPAQFTSPLSYLGSPTPHLPVCIFAPPTCLVISALDRLGLERHGDGLQECQPFSAHRLTDCLDERNQWIMLLLAFPMINEDGESRDSCWWAIKLNKRIW